jgi:hypothetical protein
MLKIMLITFLLSLSTYAKPTSLEIKCLIVEGGTEQFKIDHFQLSQTSSHLSDLKFGTRGGQLNYFQVDCQSEVAPDQILTCQSDDFSLVIDLSGSPILAYLDPFVFHGENRGPFGFECAKH